MISLTDLPENDAARAITNREPSHKMRFKPAYRPFINTGFST
jgi:hypothetical protein